MTNPTKNAPPRFGQGSYSKPVSKRPSRRVVVGGAALVILAILFVVLGPMQHILPGFRYHVLFAKDVAPASISAPPKHLKGYSSTPVSKLSAPEQQVLATEQHAQQATLDLVQSYASNQWCRPLYTSGGKGNPQPPDPTQGLEVAQKLWPGAGVLGKVTPNFCKVSYFSKNWYLLGVPFGPVDMSATNSYEPVAIEMQYVGADGRTYHVFFIEVVKEAVRSAFTGEAAPSSAPQVQQISGSYLVAMYWDNTPASGPEWVTSMSDFNIPGNAVINPAVAPRTPLPTNTPHPVYAPPSKKVKL